MGGRLGTCVRLAVQCHNSRLLMKRNLYGIRILVSNLTCWLTLGCTNVCALLLELSDENRTEFWILVLQKTIFWKTVGNTKWVMCPIQPSVQPLLVCRVLTGVSPRAASVWVEVCFQRRAPLLHLMMPRKLSQVCQCASPCHQSIPHPQL